jgi:hypothetical protein
MPNDTTVLDTPVSTTEVPVTVVPPAAAKGVRAPFQKPVLRVKKSAALLPDEPAPAPEAAGPSTKAKAPVSTATRMFVVRVVAPGSKLDPGATVTWHDPKAGQKFNGDKNKARFAKGVASGKTTVGELLKLDGGPRSGDLRHWVEHSYSPDGQPWIEVSGMRFLAPKK